LKKASAVIVAAGSGSRMKLPQKKQFLELCGKPVWAWSVAAFESCPRIGEIVLVVPPEDVELCEREVLDARLGGPEDRASADEQGRQPVFIRVVAGGEDRQKSVYRGIAATDAKYGIVAVHDGVRALIEPGILDRAIGAAEKYGAACVAVPVTDTIKQVASHEGGAACVAVPVTDTIKQVASHEGGAACVAVPVTDTIERTEGHNCGVACAAETVDGAIKRTSSHEGGAASEEKCLKASTVKKSGNGDDSFNCNGFIESTIDRRNLWAAQTPQVFNRDTVLKALEAAEGSGYSVTDESSLIEITGGKVAIVMGSYENIKITSQTDLSIAEYILRDRLSRLGRNNA